MTFGDTIRQLLKINNLKMSHLASALDYDISYISKWVNGTKLPPAQNVRAISLAISKFIKKYGTEETIENTVAQFRLHDIISGNLDLFGSDNFEEAITGILVDAFNYRAADMAPKPAMGPPPGSLFISAGDISPDFSAAVSQLFSRAFSTCGSPNVECVMIISPANHLLTDDCMLEELSSLCALHKKKIHIRQLMDAEHIRNRPAEMCSSIFRQLSYCSNIEFEFYVFESSPEHPQPKTLLLLKDSAVMQVFIQPFTGTAYAAATSEPSVVSDYYWAAAASIKRQQSLVKRMPISIFARNNISYQHTLLPNGINYCLFREMSSIHFDTEMLDELLEAYVANPQIRTLSRQQHTIQFSSFETVFLHKSTIIEYIKTGKIHLFDPERICLTTEQRKRHLQHLIDEIMTGEHLSLNILDDINTVLSYNESLLTVLYKDGSAFANHIGKNFYYIISPCLREALPSFFSKLKDVCMNRELTVDFLQKCIRML